MPSPVTGQVTVSGTAQPLSAATVACTAYVINAPLTNANPVFIGPAGVLLTTGHQLDPGGSFSYERKAQSGQTRLELSISDFYVVGTSPDRVTWFASPSLS